MSFLFLFFSFSLFLSFSVSRVFNNGMSNGAYILTTTVYIQTCNDLFCQDWNVEKRIAINISWNVEKRIAINISKIQEP